METLIPPVIIPEVIRVVIPILTPKMVRRLQVLCRNRFLMIRVKKDIFI